MTQTWKQVKWEQDSACLSCFHMISRLIHILSPLYNMTMGHPQTHKMGAVPSTLYQVVNFPTLWSIGEIKGDQENSHSCYCKILKRKTMVLQKLHHKSLAHTQRTHFIEGDEEFDEVHLIEGDSSRNINIRFKLPAGLRKILIDFLWQTYDCFPGPMDILDIGQAVIMHKLQVDLLI